MGVYSVFGLEVGFTWWFVYNIGNSFVGVMSVAATSLCTAHWLILMQESVYGEDLRRIYFECVQYSWLRFIPFFDLGVVVATVLVLSELKVVWNGVMTWPCFCQEGLSRTIGDGDQKRLSTSYFNFFGERLFAGEMLYFLSESSTMCTLTSQVLPLRMGRINAEPQIESDPAIGYNHAFVHGMFAACDVGKRMMYRIVFVGFLRIAIPLHLQVTLFAIQSEANAELKINLPCGLFPVIVGFLSAAPVTLDILEWLMSFHKVQRIYNETPEEEREKIPHWFKGTQEEFMARCDLGHIQRLFSVFSVLALIFALLMLFEAFKMYAVTFMCKGRNWGFPGGCFDDTVLTE
jgi:uncharacterized integral membrane protein